MSIQNEIEVPNIAEGKLLPSRLRSLIVSFVVGAVVFGLGSYILFYPPAPDYELMLYIVVVPGIVIIGGVYGFTAYFLYHSIRYRTPRRLLKVFLAGAVLSGPAVGFTGTIRVWGLPFCLYVTLVIGLVFWFVLD